MSSPRNARTLISGVEVSHSGMVPVRTSRMSYPNVAEKHVTDSEYILLPPKKSLVIDSSLCKKLAAALVTRYSPDDDPRMKVPVAIASKYVPASVRQWGQGQIGGGGDRFKCRALLKGQGHSRDCTYIKVSMSHLPPCRIFLANHEAQV